MKHPAGTYIPAKIRMGVVARVDSGTWTMSVRSWDGLGGPWENVPAQSVYTHPAEGEGIHFMP